MKKIKNATKIVGGVIGFLAAIATIASLFIQVGSLRENLASLQQSFIISQRNTNVQGNNNVLSDQSINSKKSTIIAPVNSPGSQNLGAFNNNGIISLDNTGNINQNQVAAFVWSNEDAWNNNSENVDLYFKANGPILPNKVCAGIASNAQVLEIDIEGETMQAQPDLNNPLLNPPLLTTSLCFSQLQSLEHLLVKFNKPPTTLKAGLYNQ